MIPAAAVEAAAKAIQKAAELNSKDVKDWREFFARAALEAALPHLK